MKKLNTGLGYLKQAWLVLVLALVFGMALANVQAALGPRIEQNKLDEALEQVPLLVRGAIAGVPVGLGDSRVYGALGAEGELLGWVVMGNGQGFAGRIELLIGLDRSLDTVTGVYVLDQRETPGLGNHITDEKWRLQFLGKKTHLPLEVIKEGVPAAHQIVAVTGATISSKSVAQAVNKAVNLVRSRKDVLQQETRRLEQMQPASKPRAGE
ncbi:MAG: FMN-binding protein [Candidatus Omnitrophica bacterium]|nr:FMN-binding protein [Candidatus Omnitrophota bacterium]